MQDHFHNTVYNSFSAVFNVVSLWSVLHNNIIGCGGRYTSPKNENSSIIFSSFDCSKPV